METSTNTTPGGPAAQATSINSNLTPKTDSQMQTHPNHQAIDHEQLVTLKQAAEQFQVYHGTLKSNIKHGKLPAQQENPKAAYLVKSADVEKLLRTTPGIKSMFHPAACAATESDIAPVTGATPDNDHSGQATDVGNTAVAVEAAAKSSTVAKASSTNAPNSKADKNCAARGSKPMPVTEVNIQHEVRNPEIQSDGHPKKRRRRSRGRGKSTTTHEMSATVSTPFMKILAKTTPGERLTLMGCLNELAAMVASA